MSELEQLQAEDAISHALLADAKAEVERLRAALKTCLRYFEGDWDGEPEEAERIATQKVRAALEGK